MRTKALLCAAGLLAAGVATSMAQGNVYSLNVVGYINVTLTNGFNLIANQLDLDGTANFTNNTVTSVLGTNLPANSKAYAYDTAGGYTISTFNGTAWGPPGTLAGVAKGLTPGRGVWVSVNGTPGFTTTITEVGNVIQGSKAFPVVSGFQIMSVMSPVQARISTDFGYPAANGDKVSMYRNGAYQIRTHNGTAWGPPALGEPTNRVAEAFWLQASASKTWTQNFTVP
jgi:hypothetical protein